MAGQNPGLWRPWGRLREPATRAPGHLGEPGVATWDSGQSATWTYDSKARA